MKFKSQKGFTLTSIAISVVIIYIFASLIAMLVYNYNSTMKSTELKAKATTIAVNEIEKIKGEGYDTSKYNGKTNDAIIEENVEVENNEGFFKTVKVNDYKDLSGNTENELIEYDIVKIVKVEISYKFKKKIKKVELSTIISNANKGEN